MEFEAANKPVGLIFKVVTKWDISLPGFSIPNQPAVVKEEFQNRFVLFPRTYACIYFWTYNVFSLLINKRVSLY